MTYTVQEARERLSEILQKVQDGERVVISDEGRDVAEVRAVKRKPISTGDVLRHLEEEGIIAASSERRPSLEEIRQELEEAWRESPPKPGGLARFLESR